MSENSNKSTLSSSSSYAEIGEFWDSHDATEFWDKTEPVDIEVMIESETTLHAIEPTLAAKLRVVAQSRGISTETLTNLWLRERLATEAVS